MREQLVLFNQPDITETHLKGTDKINIIGYKFFGLNRVTDSQRKGSGGVGILVKGNIMELFEVNVDFHHSDSILGLKLTWKDDLSSYVMLYCVYLPPESSSYGRWNEGALNQMLLEVYKHNEVENLIICGDFNARIRTKQDCQYADNMPSRTAIDLGMNRQGEKLLTFVNDMRGCIINGRINPQSDNYTSTASHKGNAVVDYVVVHQHDWQTKQFCST